MIESISFTEFQNGIAPLWNVEPASIPIYNNPYGIIQYDPNGVPEQMLVRCVRWIEDGETKAYSSIYNIDANVLRIRGIYVSPQYRNQGIGHRIWREMADLFPLSFYRVVGFWRESSYERFMQYSNMRIVPNTDWIWSEFSQVNMRMLYWDRAQQTSQDTADYIREQLPHYGMGGSRNLNCHWSPREWSNYVEQHSGNYPNLGIDVNFDQDR